MVDLSRLKAQLLGLCGLNGNKKTTESPDGDVSEVEENGEEDGAESEEELGEDTGFMGFLKKKVKGFEDSQ